MAFNISQFQSSLAQDGARPNLFEVLVPVFDQKMSFTCKSAQLPGSTLGTVEVPYFGRMVKLAGNRQFPEWTVTIINDEDFLIRNQIEQWMASINSHEGNVSSDLFDGYSFDATVNQYGKQGDVVKSYNFVGMWPSDISPIELDWGANDTLEEFTVTFTYQYWQSDTVNVG